MYGLADFLTFANIPQGDIIRVSFLSKDSPVKNGNPLLLSVDDEDAICDLIKYTMEPEGIEVITAENGRSALALLEKEPVDVVITDLLMPSMTGLEFIREMKKRKSNLPIIVITAYGNVDMAKQILAEGVFKLVEKPLDFATLVPMTKDALRKQGITIR